MLNYIFLIHTVFNKSLYFFINYQQENATSNSKQNAAALLDLIYLSSKSVPIFMNMLEKHLVLSPLRFEFEFYYVQPIQVSPLYSLRQSSIIVDLETIPAILVLYCSSVDHLHVLVYFFQVRSRLEGFGRNRALIFGMSGPRAAIRASFRGIECRGRRLRSQSLLHRFTIAGATRIRNSQSRRVRQH